MYERTSCTKPVTKEEKTREKIIWLFGKRKSSNFPFLIFFYLLVTCLLAYVWMFVEKSKDSHSDQHLISPYSYTAESFSAIMRTKEMIANLNSFDC